MFFVCLILLGVLSRVINVVCVMILRAVTGILAICCGSVLFVSCSNSVDSYRRGNVTTLSISQSHDLRTISMRSVNDEVFFKNNVSLRCSIETITKLREGRTRLDIKIIPNPQRVKISDQSGMQIDLTILPERCAVFCDVNFPEEFKENLEWQVVLSPRGKILLLRAYVDGQYDLVSYNKLANHSLWGQWRSRKTGRVETLFIQDIQLGRNTPYYIDDALRSWKNEGVGDGFSPSFVISPHGWILFDYEKGPEASDLSWLKVGRKNGAFD